MADYTSRSRDTDVAKHLEKFLDGFLHSDFAYGFDTLVSSLEDIAEAVDSDAKNLEERIAELEEELREAKNTIVSLEEERS